MKRICALIIAAAICMPSASFAYTLQWKLKEGERVEEVKTASVRLFLNSMQTKVYRERNIVDFTCYGTKEKASCVKGFFSIYHAEPGSDIFRLEAREFSDFVISPEGKMAIPGQYLMPNLRQLPVFPARDIAVGDTWSFEGEIVFTHLSKPFIMGFPVSYKLERVERRDGHDIATVSYSWAITRSLNGMNFPADFPLMISGKDRGFFQWDITDGKPLDSSDDYRMAFLQPDGINTIEFQMGINSANRVYPVVTPEAGEKARAELEQDLGGKSGITVAPDPRGIAVRMGEVLFDFDSAALRADTKKTLDAVIETLKRKYPDREIIVEGHTDSTGRKDYNQALSDKRAENVARYLSNGAGHDKFSYRGFASGKPIADNATEDGRKKNRRVEIIIKLN